MQQNRNIILSLLVGIIFSGTAIFVSFKNVPLDQLLDYMETIDFRWVMPSILTGLASYFVRAFRWQMILKPVKKMGFWHTYHPLTIAFMINCILPGRVGELARPTILYKRDNIAFSKGLATIGVERIFDLIALLALFVFVMNRIHINPDLSLAFNGYRINQDTLQTILAGMLKAGIILIGLIISLMLPVVRKALSLFVSWLPSSLIFMPEHYRRNLGVRVHARTQVILDNISQGFEVLKSPVKIVMCLLLSFVIWLLVFFSFYILTLGCHGVSITFLQASAVTMFICFFIMLPSVPGFWGIWEIGGIYGLMLFGVPKVPAAGITLAFHAFQIFPIVLLGMISAWVTGVNILQAGLHSQKIDQDKGK